MVTSTWEVCWAILGPRGAGVLKRGAGEAAGTVSLSLRRGGGLGRQSELPVPGGMSRGHMVLHGGLKLLSVPSA